MDVSRSTLAAAVRALRGAAAGIALAVLAAFPSAPARARPTAEPDLERVSSHLRSARALARQRAPLTDIAEADPALQLRDGRLAVEIRFSALAPGVVESIAALGARVEHASYRYARVVALADPAQLAALAALPGVAMIHPLYGAQRSSGAVPGQGDAGVRGDRARARFGVDGSGVRVGILSDSFNRRIGGAIGGSGCSRLLAGSSSQFSGDLPSQVAVLDDGPQGSLDEGAAMGEIIHDLAPGAELLFASAYPDEAAFAESIAALTACGADVLVDDVLFFAEPMFQDGIIAQAAQAAVDGGAAFFSATGNQGVTGVDQVYRDAVPETDDEADAPTGNDFHDFGGGQRFAAITLPPGCGVRVVLQWDEPFAGTLGPGASTDLDLYVLAAQSPNAQVLAAGIDSQGCATSGGGASGEPLEIAVYQNGSTAARTVYLAIDHFCGRDDVHFRVVPFTTSSVRCPDAAFADVFHDAQIYGHPAAAGVAAVGAVFYGEIDSGGAAVAPGGVINVEPFSARGGELPIAIDAHGQRLPGGALLRFKPDLVAPDGVNTTFFGSDSAFDDDSYPNFLGTSAAAPHAAAVAALLRQADPSLMPDALLSMLRETAVDVEAAGRDVLAGDGLVDADAALEALIAPATPTPSATPTATTVAALPPGDCDHDGHVAIDELITGVRIALDEIPATACGAADRNADGHVAIDELVLAVAAALAT